MSKECTTRKRIRLQWIRHIVQFLFVVVFLWLLIRTKYPLNTPVPAEIWLRLDPLLALTTWIARRSFIVDLIPALALISITLILGRIFCGWICPLGSLIDASDRLVFNRRWNKKGEYQKPLRRLKLYLLVGLFVLTIFGLNLAGLFDPLSIITRSFVLAILPAMGYFANGVLNISRAISPARLEGVEVASRFYALGMLSLLGLVGILGFGFFGRRFWCRNLCPLGALLGIVSRFSFLTRLTAEACEKCQICKAGCTMACIEKPDLYHKEECIACLRCLENCPRDIIQFKFKLPRISSVKGMDFQRRQLLSGIGFSLLSVGVLKTALAKRAPVSRLIRPPGALPEEDFLAACTRCSECIKVCRTNVLQPTLLEAGFEGIWTPRLMPRRQTQIEEGGCLKYCNLCTLVCPTNALRKLTLKEKQQFRLGLSNLARDRCLAWDWNTPCKLCYDYCPYDAIELKPIDGMLRPVLNHDKCMGCGTCEHVCPVKGSAILVTAQRESRAQGNRNNRPVDDLDEAPLL